MNILLHSDPSDWVNFVQIQAMHCGYGPVDLIGCLQIQERKLSVTAKTGKQLILILFEFTLNVRIAHNRFSRPNLSSCEAGVLQCQSVPGCHVDGGWSQWGAWTECSVSCGGGVKFRRRLCDNPSPQSGGRGCLGDAEQQRDCNTHLCTGIMTGSSRCFTPPSASVHV